MKRNTKRDELRFTTMEVRAGAIEVRTVTFPRGRRVETLTSTSAFTPVTRTSFATAVGDTQFKPNQPGVLGITDVYRLVVTIGTTGPGSLMELSIFSHGWMVGPILVNSSDGWMREIAVPMPMGNPAVMQVPVVGCTRDPDDKDGKARLDFPPPTMEAGELVNFHDEFHADGFVAVGVLLPTRHPSIDVGNGARQG